MVNGPYWVAARLLAWAEVNWREIDGSSLLEGGIDLASLYQESPSRFLSAIYVLSIRGLDEQKRAEFDFKLNQPPVWENAAEPRPEELEADGAAFLAAAASFPGRRG